MSNQNTAVIFARVSSEDQRDGFSLDAQLSAAKSYCLSKKLLVVATWKEQESASKESDRKKFFEMLEYVRNNKVKHVIFDKSDRAVRGSKSVVLLEELVNECDISLHFLRDNLIFNKNSPPSERFQLDLQFALAKHYAINLSAEIKKGSQQRLEQG